MQPGRLALTIRETSSFRLQGCRVSMLSPPVLPLSSLYHSQFSLEDGDSMIPRNTGKYLQDYTVSLHRRM
jgi:hypothetical protein